MRFRDIFWLSVAKIYSSMYLFFHDRFGIKLRGLGSFMDRISTDLILSIEGQKLYQARAYIALFTG